MLLLLQHNNMPWLAAAQLSSRASSTDRSSCTTATPAALCEPWLPLQVSMAAAKLLCSAFRSVPSGRSMSHLSTKRSQPS